MQRFDSYSTTILSFSMMYNCLVTHSSNFAWDNQFLSNNSSQFCFVPFLSVLNRQLVARHSPVSVRPRIWQRPPKGQNHRRSCPVSPLERRTMLLSGWTPPSFGFDFTCFSSFGSGSSHSSWCLVVSLDGAGIRRFLLHR